jgi:hypothetical protein
MMREAGVAGGGAGGVLQCAGSGKHAMAVCDDGAGALGGGMIRELEGRAEALAGTFTA